MDRRGRTALVVEDEAATRALIARCLRATGLEVTEAESAERVLVDASRRHTAWDVVVADVHLPGMSGLDLVAEVLARRPSQPVVLITGDPDAALARDSLACGPVTLLLKPFDIAQLDAAVAAALMRQDMSVDWGATVLQHGAGNVPQAWLDLADRHSFAGAGHARRVGRLALVLAEGMPGFELRVPIGELLVAAWSHELGRLAGRGAVPSEAAEQGARLLEECDCAPGIVRGVRHLHERWDGSGGPAGLAGVAIPPMSRVLAVADALDHYIAAWIQAGRSPAEAAARALGLVRVQARSAFCPDAADAAQRQQSRIQQIAAERSLNEAA